MEAVMAWRWSASVLLAAVALASARVGADEPLNASLFPLADVDLGLIPRLLADARARARTAEARVIQALFERSEGYGDSASWGRPLLRLVVDGPRGGAIVEYRLDGKHRHTIRW
jgi:hypothetical protein